MSIPPEPRRSQESGGADIVNPGQDGAAAGEALIARVRAYDQDADADALRRAVDFAIKYHGSQKRASGDPYYLHPIEVADILAGMRLDTTTIITAILHDTVEDTAAAPEDITREFGQEIGQLVEGVTKLTKIEFVSDNHKQAENFRKLLVAISEDVRVLLVKLADRLHNMRTLSFIGKPEKRRRIAHETMEIYAPLAERIGMQKVKDELQDLAFRELNPDGYASVESRLQYLRSIDPEMVARTAGRMTELLAKAGIQAEVHGREKMPYSIWRKMQRKNVSFEQLSDIVAFRILTHGDTDCYRALGIVHSAYHTVPGSFKDFISTPKVNAYQSIHTVVMGPENQRVEIQIRTSAMHEVAEMGVAAHWSYKQDRAYNADGPQYRWVRELLQIIEQSPDDPDEFMANTKLQMYHDQVFCFTPRGDLIALPRGATPVDFAFAVHSNVGLTCAGAKINGKLMPLRTQLKNGDQVEIVQSKAPKPSPSWEHFAVTGKAKSEIRRFIRTQQRGEYAGLGKEMLSKALQTERAELHEKALEPLLEKFGKKTLEELYAALGEGTLPRQEVVRALVPREAVKPSLLSRFGLGWKEGGRKDSGRKENIPIPIMGLIPGMAIHFAGCCHPLPGERIAGIVNSGRGVTIHGAQCGELEHFLNQPERWVDVAWDMHQRDAAYVGRIKAVVAHRKGALGSLTNTIAQGDGNINNLRIVNRGADFFEMVLDVEVRDLDHLESIMALLRSRPEIQAVERYREGKQ